MILRPSKQGFDIVIGNPPYVEAKKLKHIASILKEPYNKISSGTADLSVYFIELGRKLMNDAGCLYFITTNKFFNTGYGKKVRKMLCEQTIISLINFEQVEVFEDVLVSSVVLGFSKKSPSIKNNFVYEQFYKLKAKKFKDEFIAKQENFVTYPQQYLGDGEWSFPSTSEMMLKKHIEIGATPLSDVEGVKIYRGVTTGYNPAFIIDNLQKEELIKLDSHNSSIIKDMLQGRNIRKWYYNESNENLIFTRRGISINEFPVIKRYLQRFYMKLKPKTTEESTTGRKPGKYNWYEILDNTAYFREFEVPEKIIWGLTADKWAFAYDNKRHYLPSNGYILTSSKIPVKYILALLNSKLFHYYFGYIGVMTAGGAYTLKASTIAALPFKKATEMRSYESIVNGILVKKSKDKQCDVSAEEIAIDLLVYHLYDLTYDEVLIIDPNIPVSRDVYDK